MEQAPLRTDLARNAAGAAFWLETADGMRLRAALWPAAAPRGTVFLLPGRTEYIEKYGLAAGDLAARGHTVLSIDWRGQGLADRLHPERARGHIRRFSEFQLDLDALTDFAEARALPRPWFILAHSMAGAIALRRLLRPHPFAAAAFSAPMWGINLPGWLRGLCLPLAHLLRHPPLAGTYVPSSGPAPYVLHTAFDGNLLTSDPEMWRYLVAQAEGAPEAMIGGPTLGWGAESLLECRALAKAPSPALPCLAAIGTEERIVDTEAIRARMQRWPNGRLLEISGGRHEVMMETPARRAEFYDAVAGLFDSAAETARRAVRSGSA